MRRFRFNLQRVLDYRQSIEERLLAELAVLRSQHDQELGKLIAAIGERDKFRKRMKEKLAAGSADDIKQAYSYLNELGRQVRMQELAVRKVAQARDAKTTEVIEAARDRKALERLRDYKRLEHGKEVEVQEQKFLDDVACMRHNRVMSEREAVVEG